MSNIKRNDLSVVRRRKTLSLDLKRTMIADFEAGLKASEIAQKYNLNHSTVSTILKQKDKIIEAVNNDHPLNTNLIRKRHGIIADMEVLLRAWCEQEMYEKNLHLDQKTICNKAREIFHKLKKDTGDEDNVKFLASNGWFIRFKKRCNNRFGVQYEDSTASESTSYAKIDSHTFSDELKNIVNEDGFTPETVFNVRETSLFWKRMLKRMPADNDDSSQSFRDENDRFTVMLGGNAAGTCKLKPLSVYHSDNPKALKNKSKAGLPVIWKFNPKGVVTASIFEDWFGHHFIPEVKKFCKSQGMPFKVMLIIDNAPGHPPATLVDFDPRVKVVFLPSESAGFLQPMDQGVIKTFKAYYTRRALGLISDSMLHNDELPLEDFWNALSILDAVRLIGESWAEVFETTMRNAWRNLCPYFNYDFETNYMTGVINDIVALARQMNLDISYEEINAFLESHDEEHSIEDLLDMQVVEEEDDDAEPLKLMTVEKLSEGLEYIENGVRILEDIDSNEERVMSFRQNIRRAITDYLEILREKKRSASFQQDPLQVSLSTPDK